MSWRLCASASKKARKLEFYTAFAVHSSSARLYVRGAVCDKQVSGIGKEEVRRKAIIWLIQESTRHRPLALFTTYCPLLVVAAVVVAAAAVPALEVGSCDDPLGC